MAKVSGALKTLMKKIIYIKGLNLDAVTEKEKLDALRDTNPINYHEAMNKHLRRMK